MNYLLPLDTYFAKPLSIFFTDNLAMPALNTVQSSVAKVIDLNPSSYFSSETSNRWSERTVRCINLVGTRKKGDSSAIYSLVENTTLFASRTLFRKYMVDGVFLVLDHTLGDSYAANKQLIKTAHAVATWGLWILSLASNYRSMQN